MIDNSNDDNNIINIDINNNNSNINTNNTEKRKNENTIPHPLPTTLLTVPDPKPEPKDLLKQVVDELQVRDGRVLAVVRGQHVEVGVLLHLQDQAEGLLDLSEGPCVWGNDRKEEEERGRKRRREEARGGERK